ncbi:MAG: glycosyltransferase family 2 protein [Chloroflexota bacterium]
MLQNPLVSVIVVSWNTRELLRRCLASVTASRVPLEVLVVDNASTDGSPEMVRREFPRARLMANANNLGFGRANNQVLPSVLGTYVLLLNPDAELESGALERLLAVLEQRPEVGVVGPLVVSTDGSVQSTRRRFPTVSTTFVESTIIQPLLPSTHPLLRSYYVLDRADQEPQDVDWLVGACLLVRKVAIDQVGGFDPRFFMYFEETDWCRRFGQAGWSIVFEPSARVRHLGGQSSDQAPLRRVCEFNESKCRYVRKWHGLGPSLALRWFLFTTSAFQLAEELLKMALGHKRSLRRARVSLWAGVLRWQAARLIST